VALGAALGPRAALAEEPGPATVEVPSADVRFLAGLRERGLFALAAGWCRRQLARPYLPDDRRIELTLELARTLEDHAWQVGEPERDALYRQAVEACADAGRRAPAAPGRLLVDVQAALVELARGETLADELRFAPTDAARAEAARQALRAAIDRLQAVLAEIDGRLRAAPRPVEPRATAAAALSAEQLRSLDRSVRYELARAYRLQAQTYPAGSPDRTNAVQLAEEATAALVELPGTPRIVAGAWIEQARCRLLLGDGAGAAAALARLAERQPADEALWRWRAARVEVAVASGRLDEALAWVAADAEALPNVPAAGIGAVEFELAALEARLAAAGRAAEQGNDAEARTLRDDAAAAASQLAARYGSGWGRRAELLVAVGLATSPVDGDALLLRRAAEGHYRAGQIDEALRTYDQLAERARAAGQIELALETALTAAAIEQQRNRPEAAGDRLQQLALALPTHPRAAELHRSAILLAADEVRRHAPDALARYDALLAEHLEHWPRAASASAVRVWLARRREAKGDLAGAAELLSAVPVEAAEAIEATNLLAAVERRALAGLRAAGQPTAERADASAARFETLAEQARQSPAPTAAAVRRTAVLEAARCWIVEAEREFARAEQLLARALNEPAPPSGDAAPTTADEAAARAWRRAAERWRAVALAAQGLVAEAAAIVERLLADETGLPPAGAAQAGPPLFDARGWLEAAMAIDRRRAAATADEAVALARLTATVTDALRPRTAGLEPDERAAADMLAARGATALGEFDRARGILTPLVAARPRDGDVQEAWAELLLAAGGERPGDDALAAWRRVEQGSRPGSPRWFRAKYALAVWHLRRGDRRRAAEIVRLTELLHPDLGGAAMRARFEALLDAAASK
jgi:hypothetical protein